MAKEVPRPDLRTMEFSEVDRGLIFCALTNKIKEMLVLRERFKSDGDDPLETLYDLPAELLPRD